MTDIIISADRLEALAAKGITLYPAEILGQLVRMAAQTPSWDRPTLTSNTDGTWLAYLDSCDKHFSNRFESKADTPENAMADLLLKLIKKADDVRTRTGMGIQNRLN